ncbi:hypothetical protein ACFFJY_14970 [Fictibacillus aquaticus]|uniref:Uncharacterized protein n=1 Tax=Fictibacillus aquaticus TaxID=2021314 RepID=A0A235FFK8_9BACL|nr:hypothetical protein [Fictibacillus aquaticus]OYD59515.1 hypothetical protein CGZ90_06385 [Fictibacillus aquaticus]
MPNIVLGIVLKGELTLDFIVGIYQSSPLGFWIMNGIALLLGGVCAIGFWTNRHVLGEKKAKKRALMAYPVCFIFFNGIMVYVLWEDGERQKRAFSRMTAENQTEGNPSTEGQENLQVNIQRDGSRKGGTDYYVYAANFNKKTPFEGKLKVVLYDEPEEELKTFTSKIVKLKPGEKKKIDVFEGPWSYDFSRYWTIDRQDLGKDRHQLEARDRAINSLNYQYKEKGVKDSESMKNIRFSAVNTKDNLEIYAGNFNKDNELTVNSKIEFLRKGKIVKTVQVPAFYIETGEKKKVMTIEKLTFDDYRWYVTPDMKATGFAKLDEGFKKVGKPGEESQKNFLMTYNFNLNNEVEMFAANFNEKWAFKGKMELKLYKDDKVFQTVTTPEFELKPGEKKQIHTFIPNAVPESSKHFWIPNK